MDAVLFLILDSTLNNMKGHYMVKLRDFFYEWPPTKKMKFFGEEGFPPDMGFCEESIDKVTFSEGCVIVHFTYQNHEYSIVRDLSGLSPELSGKIINILKSSVGERIHDVAEKII